MKSLIMSLMVLLVFAGVANAQLQGMFADVPPNHFALAQIEAIAQAGITEGCSATFFPTPLHLFCPDAPITRGQMAVFIVTIPRPSACIVHGTLCGCPYRTPFLRIY